MKSDKVALSPLKCNSDFISAADDINKSSLNEGKTGELSALKNPRTLQNGSLRDEGSSCQGRICNHQQNVKRIWSGCFLLTMYF